MARKLATKTKPKDDVILTETQMKDMLFRLCSGLDQSYSSIAQYMMNIEGNNQRELGELLEDWFDQEKARRADEQKAALRKVLAKLTKEERELIVNASSELYDVMDEDED